MPERFYTIAEAAKKLGVSRQAIHDAIAAKGIRRIRIKREERNIVRKIQVIVIAESELEKYRQKISRSHQERGKKN